MNCGIRWLILVVLIATLVGAAVGFFRAEVSFMPGLSGLFVGVAVGFLISATGRRVPGHYRHSKGLLWLALAATVLYVGMQLSVVGGYRASAADSPLYWIGEMFSGRGGEFFFSAGTSSALVRIQYGTLSGGSWLFFNALDAVFFFCLCVVTSLGTSSGSVARPSCAPMLTALAVLVLVIGGYAAAWQFLEAAPPSRLGSAPADLQTAMRGLLEPTDKTGQWKFAPEHERHRSQIMADTFRIEPSLGGELRGIALGAPYFRFTVYPKGRSGTAYSGMIWYLRDESLSTDPKNLRGFSSIRMRYMPARREWIIVVSQPKDPGQNWVLRAVKPNNAGGATATITSQFFQY